MKARVNAKLLTVLLIFSFLLSGCNSRDKEQIPKLIEPVSANSAYRPVEYGDIEAPKMRFATVSPKETGYYFPTNVTITKLVVSPGDIVKKGDVLAYADVTEADKMLKNLKEQLSYVDKEYELTKDIVELDIEELEEAEDKVAVNVQKENLRYDKKLWKYKRGKILEEIEKYNKVIEDGTLYATAGGQVIYTMNLSYSNVAGNNDNVVVVSDSSQKYLILSAQDSEFMDYEKKYTILDGKECALSEVEYSTEELILAKAANAPVDVRLTCDAIDELEIGTNLPVYFSNSDSKKTLLVGKDSLYTENGKNFVYVKDEKGQRKKREITLGKQDSNYCQVVEGLDEGELVYYESDSVMPVDYDTYEMKSMSYTVENYSRNYEMAGEVAFSCCSEYQGKVGNLISGTEFKKGDLLYTVDTGEGAAALLEAGNAIKRENSSYKKSCNEYKKQRNQAKGDKRQLQRIKLQEELSTLNHNNTIKQLQETYRQLSENNDGKGVFSVYASCDGVVKEIKVKNGQMVEVNDEVLTIAGGDKNQLVVMMSPYSSEEEETANFVKNIADIGEAVTAVTDDKTYKGVCIGMIENEKTYLETDSKGAHVSQNPASGYADKAFYVQMEDSFYKDMPQDAVMKFLYLDIPDVLLVPRDAINVEKDVASARERCFVWRIAGDELVKQFITLSDDEAFGSTAYIPVLSGLSEGDVIVVK